MSALPIVFESWSQLLACGLVLVLAEAVYMSFGFGAGLIAVGLLATVLPAVHDVVVILLLINLPIELCVVVVSLRRVDWRGLPLIALGLLAGIPLGTLILDYARPLFLLSLLGVFLVLAGLAFLLFPAVRRRELPPWSGPPAGLASGILAGLFGTGGPPLIFYFQLRGMAKSTFRGTLMALFFLTALVRLPAYLGAGLISAERAVSSLVVLPAALLGIWLGARVHVSLSEAAFRRLVSVFLILIGLTLLSRT